METALHPSVPSWYSSCGLSVSLSVVFQVTNIQLYSHFAAIADIVSDCILMVAPLKLFRDILDKGLRRRLMFIFSASLMITIVSTIHVVYILTGQKIKNLIAANVEVNNHAPH
jgi:hypothetical protein